MTNKLSHEFISKTKTEQEEERRKYRMGVGPGEKETLNRFFVPVFVLVVLLRHFLSLVGWA